MCRKLLLPVLVALALTCLAGWGLASPPPAADITARMLVQPGALVASDLVDSAATLQAASLIIHGLADTNVHLQNSVNFIAALEEADRAFVFVPLPNEGHHYEGDGLATALSASVGYFSELLAKE